MQELQIQTLTDGQIAHAGRKGKAVKGGADPSILFDLILQSMGMCPASETSGAGDPGSSKSPAIKHFVHLPVMGGNISDTGSGNPRHIKEEKTPVALLKVIQEEEEQAGDSFSKETAVAQHALKKPLNSRNPFTSPVKEPEKPAGQNAGPGDYSTVEKRRFHILQGAVSPASSAPEKNGTPEFPDAGAPKKGQGVIQGAKNLPNAAAADRKKESPQFNIKGGEAEQRFSSRPDTSALRVPQTEEAAALFAEKPSVARGNREAAGTGADPKNIPQFREHKGIPSSTGSENAGPEKETIKFTMDSFLKGTAGSDSARNSYFAGRAAGAAELVEAFTFKESDSVCAERVKIQPKAKDFAASTRYDINAGATEAEVVPGGQKNAVSIEPPVLINQVLDGVEYAVNRNSSRIRIELNPPQLGALDMDIVVRHDRVKMVITSDNREVRNALQSNIDQLRNSLQEQGLRMERVDVFIQDRPADDRSGMFQGGAFYGDHPRRGRDAETEKPLIDAPGQAALEPVRWGPEKTGAGKVSLFV
ncbi:MAG: flagellar hook-length control protein FliK [Syntrophales bacterium]